MTVILNPPFQIADKTQDELDPQFRMAACVMAGVAVEWKVEGNSFRLQTVNPCHVCIRDGKVIVEEGNHERTP